MEIYNGTQHTIVFYDEQDCYSVQEGRKLVVKKGSEPLMVIKPGKDLSCQKGNLPNPSIQIDDIPLKGAVVFKSYDPLPEEALNKIVVVSNLYRSAVKELGGDTSKLATVDGAVYETEEAIRPCGCLALAVG